jgi:hypothetical protein
MGGERGRRRVLAEYVTTGLWHNAIRNDVEIHAHFGVQINLIWHSGLRAGIVILDSRLRGNDNNREEQWLI